MRNLNGPTEEISDVNHQSHRFPLRVLVFVGLVAAAQITWADTGISDAAPAGAPLADSRKESEIPEILVTAEHRTEVARDVPISIGTISPARLADITASGADITALQSTSPSLYVESAYGRTYPAFFIRGLGDSDFDYNADQPVSVIYDDVVLQNPILKAFPIF